MNKQGQPSAAAQMYPNLIRSETIANIPSLTAEQKPRTASAVQQFWSILETRPVESAEHKAALAKLTQITNSIKTAHNTWKAAQQQRQNLAGMSNQNQGQQSIQQQMQQQIQQPQQMPQQQQQSQPHMQGQSQPNMNQQTQAQGQPSAAILKHVSEFPFVHPTETPQGTPEGNEWLEKTRRAYMGLLTKMETNGATLRRYNEQAERMRGAGQDLPQTFVNQKMQIEASYNHLKKQVDGFRQQQAQLKNKQQQMQKASAELKAGANTATASNNAGSPQFKLQLPGQSTQAQGQAAPTAIAPNPAIDQARNAASVRNSQSPVTASQPQHGAQQQPNMQGSASFSQQNAQGQVGGAGRPALNTQQPAQMNAGSQNSNGQPVPLTHQGAINAAQRSHSEPQRPPQPPSTQTFTPTSSNRAQGEQNQNQTIPRGFKIQTELPQSATSRPSPVTIGTSRPTLGGASNGVLGVMGQPVIAQTQTFKLEGADSTSVLSKKKLTELVRQVTGGTETLSPEVEELMMEVADEFVDQIISAACKLAKLRANQVLEIRDIQYVLERNYNIRVPGYSLDEVRVVRKVNPAPAWSQKMNAVNAAKVMGGKPDA